ncbi:MAG: L,D-transpeptidase family protein [Bdellovibrionales bacterium]|nr:L,D-transpeptidase family protein [Bdellovibrionales bacterium]
MEIRSALRVFAAVCVALTAQAQTPPVPAAPKKSSHEGHLHTLILVDKKTNLLHLAHYEADDSYKILKTYHTTTGKVKGDKEQEGDLKTPEGVYQFSSKILPPTLAKKFGAMAFYMNFPNAYDQIAGCTGNGVMLHGTDTPERLKKDFDSEGCIVLAADDLKEVEKSIQLALTPILVFDELTSEYQNAGPAAKAQIDKLHEFFNSWIKDWESRDIEKYMSHYHTDFASPIKGRMFNRDQWKDYKNQLTKKYSQIVVNASDPYFFRHPKYTMMMFTQDYTSTLKNGAKGLVSRGTKILYIAEENGVPKIISESFTERYY